MIDKKAEIQVAYSVFLLLAAATGLWLIWDAAGYRLVTYSLWADYWEYTATLTEWMRDLVAPGNPHLADGSSSSRYIPTLLVLAALGTATGLDAIELMAIHGVVNYALIVWGIWLFSRELFRNPWAPLVTFLILFCGWGIPWIWSNLYELRSFFMVASYPSTFVFGLSLISFWLTLAFLRGKVAFFAGIGGLLLLSALMFLSHALTGVFAIAGCCLLALTDPDSPFSLRGLVILATIAGAAAADLWPYFSVWDVVLARSDEVDDRTWQSFAGVEAMLARARSGAWWHMFFDPRQFTVALGPALLGIPLAIWLLVRRQYLFIPLGALLMSLPLIANVFFQIALAHRFLLYVVFFMHLALIWAVLELFDHWRAERRVRLASAGLTSAVVATGLTIVFLAVMHVALLVGDYRGVHLKYTLEVVDKRKHLPFELSVPMLYRALVRDLPEDAIVIGNSRLTWPMPTFRGKAVSLPENHENSLVPDLQQRADDERRFLTADTSSAERIAILRRYGATHVLVNVRNTEPALLDWLASRTDPVAAIERYHMRAFRERFAPDG